MPTTPHEPPVWAPAVGLDEVMARFRALPPPAHLRDDYSYPPPHTADVYGRGDAGPALTAASRQAATSDAERALRMTR